MATLPASAAPANCFVPEVHGTTRVQVYIGDRRCVDLREPETIGGIWINRFEGSVFHEDVDAVSTALAVRSTVWLSMDDQTVKPRDFVPAQGHAYQLTLVARKAKDMRRPLLEGYGHFGAFAGLVLVDEVVAWKDLGKVGF
ncbi:hypothetical protein CHU95_07345 [Niveispirillum lacus]|uniref:Uncharacterized protein n=1 Tax=Niveispirillum lacus TaxID=1981099 RepID=A0A255Z3N1_9PROT|nr:hypothetical protein [Niveispirillum lacus]OYQ35534.1 hypothetical protein CHU95_07345 [Niveispirillum lacus]